MLDTSHKLFPGRLAYKHELNTIEITAFDGNHLLIGEGEYGQVYGVKPTELSPELGNMIKLGTTRYGKSSAELCQIVDWDGSEVIFDIKGEIYPKVAGYLATRGRLITIDSPKAWVISTTPAGAYQRPGAAQAGQTSRL